MTPSRLLAECADARELQELMAFLDVTHQGETADDRADLRAATLAANAWNVLLAEHRQPATADPADFLPRFADPDAAEPAAMDAERLDRLFSIGFAQG